MEKCKSCGKKLKPSLGPRKKEFCNNTCRSRNWYAGNVAKTPPKKKKLSKKKEVAELSEHFKKGETPVITFSPTTPESFNGNKEIPPMPVREPGESALDFGARKSLWKKQYGG